MKKFTAASLFCAALALSACESNTTVDYDYEQQAPFATERTVGTAPVVEVSTKEVSTKRADKVFTSAQRK
jgi:uncharacterized protein YcfL